MLRICVQLLLAANVVNSSRFSFYPLLGLSNPPAGVECVDDVCKLPTPSTNSFKAEVVNLESKILKEWKAAGQTEHSSDSSEVLTPAVESAVESSAVEASLVDTVDAAAPKDTTVPIAVSGDSENTVTENTEPADLDTKINELKKMGFSAVDAKIALKQTNYEVSEAAAMLELEEEEKEIIREKVAEIGEEHS